MLVAAAALTVAAGAHAASPGRFVSLPSPIAALSLAPPLNGGATATTEGFRHRVDARTHVEVRVDALSGTPFAVHALQRLDVRVKGDYFFTIGAPALDAEATPGSASTPGFRSTSIIWAGFNPGRRILGARVTLNARATAAALPLRIDVRTGRTTLINTTAVTVGGFSADATVPPLLAYVRSLQRSLAAGSPPAAGGAYLTSTPRPTRVHVVAPLVVSGRVGSHVFTRTITDRLVLPGTGPIRISVRPQSRPLHVPTGATGRQLLAIAIRAALEAARVHQYQTFLGNPDPTGRNTTTYEYVSAERPVPAVAATPLPAGRNWMRTIVVIAVLVGGTALGLAAWSRS